MSIYPFSFPELARDGRRESWERSSFLCISKSRCLLNFQKHVCIWQISHLKMEAHFFGILEELFEVKKSQLIKRSQPMNQTVFRRNQLVMIAVVVEGLSRMPFLIVEVSEGSLRWWQSSRYYAIRDNHKPRIASSEKCMGFLTFSLHGSNHELKGRPWCKGTAASGVQSAAEHYSVHLFWELEGSQNSFLGQCNVGETQSPAV